MATHFLTPSPHHPITSPLLTPTAVSGYLSSVMYTFFLILLILDAVVLSAAVLLQSGSGGGLSAEFGGASSTDAFVGNRQAATLLTKASWWGGGIFLGLCFILSLMSMHTTAPRSVFENQGAQEAPAPQPVAPLPLESTAAPSAGAPLPLGTSKAPQPAKSTTPAR